MRFWIFAARLHSLFFLLHAGVCIRSGSVPSYVGLVLQWVSREGSPTRGARRHMEGYFPGASPLFLVLREQSFLKCSVNPCGWTLVSSHSSQIDLPHKEVVDLTLQKRCSEALALMSNSWQRADSLARGRAQREPWC